MLDPPDQRQIGGGDRKARVDQRVRRPSADHAGRDRPATQHEIVEGLNNARYFERPTGAVSAA